MTRIMAHFLNIPICFRFLRVPCAWEIRTITGQRNKPVRFAFGKLELDGSLDAARLYQLDAWSCREEFLDLPHNEELLLGFLSKVGVWNCPSSKLVGHHSEEITQHCRDGHPEPVSVDGIWNFREGLKDALLDHKTFRETYAPPRSRPETLDRKS